MGVSGFRVHTKLQAHGSMYNEVEALVGARPHFVGKSFPDIVGHG